MAHDSQFDNLHHNVMNSCLNDLRQLLCLKNCRETEEISPNFEVLLELVCLEELQPDAENSDGVIIGLEPLECEDWVVSECHSNSLQNHGRVLFRWMFLCLAKFEFIQKECEDLW